MIMSDKIDYDKLAASIINQLQASGLSRRDMIIALGSAGVAGAGLLSTIDTASASEIDGIVHFDQLGTESEPVKQLYVEQQTNFNEDEAFEHLTVTKSLNDGGVVVDGDGVFREHYVIASGASDPTGADADDIIFEEEGE